MRGAKAATTLALALALAACGGGGGGGGGGGAAAGGGQTVSLSGVVTKGTQLSNGTAVGALMTGAVPKNGNGRGLLVLAVDANGNTTQAVADPYGRFTLQVQPGTSYAVLFLDMTRMFKGQDPVVGVLAPGARQQGLGAIAANANGSLGTIVVNPQTGKALIDPASGASVQPSRAPAPLQQGLAANGKVTYQKIISFQAQHAAQASTVAAATLLPQPKAWWISKVAITDQYGNITDYSYQVHVAAPYLTEGRAGQVVGAVLEVGVDYYTVKAQGGGTGQASPPPNTFNPTNPAFYVSRKYVDGSGMWFANLGSKGWTRALPARIALNQWVQDVIGPYDNCFDSVTGQPSAVTTSTVNYRMRVVKNPDGTPRLFRGYPVYKLEGTSQDITTSKNGQPLCVPAKSSSTFYYYIIGGLGVWLEVSSPAVSFDQALTQAPFGMIQTTANGAFQTSSVLNPYAQLQNVYMPSKPTLDAWLAYAWNNRNRMTGAFGLAQNIQNAYFYLPTDPYGKPVMTLTPQPLDPYGIPTPVARGGSVQVQVQAGYAGRTTETFAFEWRTPAGQRLGNAVNATETLLTGTAAAGTAKLSATLTAPAQPGWADLWLVMKNANGQVLQRQPLASYLVQ